MAEESANESDPQGNVVASQQSTGAEDSLAKVSVDNDHSTGSGSNSLSEERNELGDQEESEPLSEFDVTSRREFMTRRRLLFLLPGGPMIVDLWLQIDGRMAALGIKELARRVIDASDTNSDGQSTWKELIANDDFLRGPLVTKTAKSDEKPGEWKKKYDHNQNGRIENDEAQAWLGRAMGRSAHAVTLDSSRSYVYDIRDQSPVWRLLDVNSDNRMSAEEIKQAPSRLLSRDADDDYVIVAGELKFLRDQVRAASGNTTRRRRQNDRRAALFIEPDGDWYRVYYLLGDMYASRRNLSPRSFSLFPNLYSQLDADGNGRLNLEEIARFDTLEPHLTLETSFGSPGGGKGVATNEASDYTSQIATTLTPILSKKIRDRGSLKQMSDSRWVLGLPGNEIVLTALDMLSPAAISKRPSELPPESRLLRVMIHDQGDQLMGVLDRDGDGRLGEREIDTVPLRLESLDSNRDQQLDSEELPRRWVFAILRGEKQIENRLFIPQATRTHTTKNRPPVLTRQEAAKADSNGSDWFRDADINRDGEISRREFLGTERQFNQLDSNHNGFVESSEVESVGRDE